MSHSSLCYRLLEERSLRCMRGKKKSLEILIVYKNEYNKGAPFLPQKMHVALVCFKIRTMEVIASFHSALVTPHQTLKGVENLQRSQRRATNRVKSQESEREKFGNMHGAIFKYLNESHTKRKLDFENSSLKTLE